MSVRILVGDCRQSLRTLPDQSVHCCVTSPPYFGLRDYGTAKWDGGDPGCDHKHDTAHQKQGATSARAGRSNTEAQRNENFRGICGKCGAVRVDGQIGLEPTPDAFVAELVAVFREVRRVLRDDGTVWLNLGDSYVAGGRGGGGSFAADRPGWDEQPMEFGKKRGLPGLKSKDLVGIPWMVAFALRADGWYLRQDIIWSKPNPMPESVRDRCTKAHEYVFLLSKSARYFYDADAIAEPVESGPSDVRKMKESLPRIGGKHKDLVDPLSKASSTTNIGRKRSVGDGEMRNRRSVWNIATAPFADAHFATFPPDLIEPMILAGCPKGGTVLDPFGGAGTTGLVADRLQRNAILCELNPAYAAMADRRLSKDAPLFADVAVAE